MSYPSRFVEYPSSETTHYDEKYPPGYDEATSSVDSASIRTPLSTGSAVWHPTSPFADPSLRQNHHGVSLARQASANSMRRPLPQLQSSQPPEYERYVYTYRLVAGGAPMQFLISVEPCLGTSNLGKYTFRLSMKVNGIERPLSEPTQKMLKVDPRELDFVVFIFPGKSSLPAGCLWSLRVWLRVKSIDHRLFGEDELWIGKDPDFNSIGDASFARLKEQDSQAQVYSAYVGRALVSFIVRWARIQGNLYKYSLDYEAGGVGGNLFEDFRLRLEIDPRSVNFLVFTVPSNSVPAGASHKLRVWVRSIVPVSHSDPSTSYVMPFNDSYIYQRIWKTDDFKIGAQLQFESLGPRMVMGFSTGGPELIPLTHTPHQLQHHRPSSSLDETKRSGYDF